MLLTCSIQDLSCHSVQTKLEDFVATARSRRGDGGFLIDFDGTLSEIVDDPQVAVLVDGTRRVLEMLASSYRAVVLVTGRRASWLSNLVGATQVRYMGLYGAEELIGGEVVQGAEAERWRSSASRLARDAEALVTTQGLAGCKVEFKDLAVSVHYRGAPDAGLRLIDWASQAAPRRGFEASLGRMVVELRPKEVSKSNALRRVVAEQDLQWVVVAGDDLADVEMMQAARELLGDHSLCIGVESSEVPDEMKDASDLRVESPEKLVETLVLFETL